MEGQKTLNQYFTARKNDISLQPSKKRKLDLATNINSNIQNRRYCFENKSQLEILDLFKDSSKSIEKIEEKKFVDDHCSSQIQVSVSLKRKSTAESSEILNQELLFKSNNNNSDSLISCNKTDIKCCQSENNNLREANRRSNFIRGNVKTISAINEQAKTTLFSRGSKLVKAGLLKSRGESYNKKQSNSKEINSTAIPLLSKKVELKSEQNKSYSDIPLQCNLKQCSAIMECDSVINPLDKKVEFKSELRNKYAHLLQDDLHVKNRDSINKNHAENSLCVNEMEEKSNQPAHLKYKHLIHKNVSELLILPNKYKVILEMIRCVDSILYLLNQRKEVCTFDKLKKSVQSMNGREFSLKHLASIKTVYPTGYVFRQEILKKFNPVDYHLTIEANFKDVTSSNIITPSVLITRRLKVENILINITKLHHQNFLQQLNINVDSEHVQRWHPDFKLDSVPDIELSLLPSAPVLKCYSSAVDILLQNRKDLSCKAIYYPELSNDRINYAIFASPLILTNHQTNLKLSLSNPNNNNVSMLYLYKISSYWVEKALENVARKSLSNEGQTDVEKPTVVGIQTKSSVKSLRGVSNELLNRIKLKEQKKIGQTLTCDPALMKRMALMEKLPEMARILKTFFTAEKKAAITLEDCLLKLCESYATAIPSSECEDLVRLLAELVPSWVTIVSVRKCPYIKLARDVDLNNVLNLLLTAKKDFET